VDDARLDGEGDCQGSDEVREVPHCRPFQE
jgi:hypothetical protein